MAYLALVPIGQLILKLWRKTGTNTEVTSRNLRRPLNQISAENATQGNRNNIIVHYEPRVPQLQEWNLKPLRYRCARSAQQNRYLHFVESVL